MIQEYAFLIISRRKFRSQISDNMDRWKSRGGKSQKGIYLWFGARKWIRAPKWIVVTGLFFWRKWSNLHEMLRSTKSAEKHVLLWHVYFFDGNGETYMKCWEAQNLLKSMFCCDMSIFLMEMAKLTWNAEKHKTCWKACFVVTCLICFNGNCETYMKCWEAQNLLKNMFCCDMSIFFDGNGETYMKCWEAGHAEKQKIFAEKHVLLWHVYFFDGKIK